MGGEFFLCGMARGACARVCTLAVIRRLDQRESEPTSSLPASPFPFARETADAMSVSINCAAARFIR